MLTSAFTFGLDHLEWCRFPNRTNCDFLSKFIILLQKFGTILNKNFTNCCGVVVHTIIIQSIWNLRSFFRQNSCKEQSFQSLGICGVDSPSPVIVGPYHDVSKATRRTQARLVNNVLEACTSNQRANELWKRRFILLRNYLQCSKTKQKLNHFMCEEKQYSK